MNELDLQGGYLINFLCSRPDGLGYKKVTTNTVSSDFVIEEDLRAFLAETAFNQTNFRKLLRTKFGNNEKARFAELIPFLLENTFLIPS